MSEAVSSRKLTEMLTKTVIYFLWDSKSTFESYKNRIYMAFCWKCFESRWDDRVGDTILLVKSFGFLKVAKSLICVHTNCFSDTGVLWMGKNMSNAIYHKNIMWLLFVCIWSIFYLYAVSSRWFHRLLYHLSVTFQIE